MKKKTVQSESRLYKSTLFLLRAGCFFIALSGVSGCATYHPLPINPETVHARLNPPAMNEIQIKAGEFKHPLLKPVTFDVNDGLSPDEAAILAVMVNPSLKAARDARGLATSQILQAGILPDPQFSYSFETPVGGGTSGKINGFGLGLDWDVFSLVTRSCRVAASRSHAASVNLEIAWKEWQVAESAKLHVYRLLIAEKHLDSAKAAAQVARRAYEMLKRGVDLGLETDQQLLPAQSLLREADANLLTAQSEVNTERLELNRALGFPSGKDIRVEDHTMLPLPENIPSVQELTTNIEKRRLDLLAFRRGYESQEEHLRAAIRSQFPRIGLGITESRDTDSLQTLGIGITISLPIFDRNQGRVAIERATRKQLFDEYASRLFEARADVAKIAEGLHSTAEQLKNNKKSVLELRQLAKRYHGAVDRGNASIFDYYQIMLQLYSRELEEPVLQRRLVDFAIGLEIASGQYIFTGNSLKPDQARAARKSEDLK